MDGGAQVANIREYLHVPDRRRRYSNSAMSHSSSLRSSSFVGTMKQSTKALPACKLENTYQLNPSDGQKFNASNVEKVIHKVLEKANLSSLKYDIEAAPSLVKRLTSDLQNSCKKLEMDRYKIVCQVIIAQNQDQGLAVTSRCVWNDNVDNFATVTVRTSSMVVTATVFGVYFE